MSLTRDVRSLVGPVDPTGDLPLVAPADRRADLQWILATGAPGRSPRRRRTLMLAGAVATALVVAAVAGLQGLPMPRPAHAATPAPLAYTGAPDDAAGLLTAIAGRAAGAARPGTGDREHLVIRSWDLWTTVDGERVTSAVVPVRTESWRAPDDSGRITFRHEEPQFPPGTNRWRWRLQNLFGADRDARTDTYGAGQFPSMWPGRPPVTGLDTWLHAGHPRANGPAETLVAVTDLARSRVLDPAVRSGLWRIVAGLPGLRHDGTVTDRAGRTGAAFSVDSDHSGLPTRYTLIVDPATGALWGYEKTLTTSTGRLDVATVPAVIGYEVYDVAEYR